MDLLLRHAWLVDGSGDAGRVAEIAVTGDRIAAIGRPGQFTPGRQTQVVDLDGLALAPGFIDVHTHYDAQILWDGDLTPSCWHGVTSVIMGNCGFGIAPARPEHREILVRTLENVEGMSMEALEAGIDWCFESFPQYMSALERRGKRLNVGALVGHTPLRLFVLGGEERPATAGEIERMRRLLREAIDAGAAGFSTSRQPAHQGAFGRPVPSRFAEMDEIRAMAAVLGDAGKGILQVSIGPGLFVQQFSELAAGHGIPVTWTALVARADKPGAALRTVERGGALPGEVYPQIACRPIVMQITMTDPAPLAEIDEWKEVLARPRAERATLYRDAAWRERARPATLAAWAHRWPKTSVEETGAHRDAVGIPLDRLARERGTTPFDLMLDLALADDMATRFRVVLDNDGDDEIGALLADRRTLLGLSDAGAHAASSATPASPPTCSGTGRGTARPSRWKMPSGGSPAIQPGRSGSPGGAWCGKATSPTWWPSTRPPSGRRRSSVYTTSRAAPTGSWCAARAWSTCGSTAWRPAARARMSPGRRPGGSCAADRRA